VIRNSRESDDEVELGEQIDTRPQAPQYAPNQRMMMSDLQKLVWNKRDLYMALSIKGQYFLMH
jgi:hypothetical protein